jgi:hypothetical protein
MSNVKARLAAAALAVAITGVALEQASADRLDEAAIYIEINATDGDAGIQLFLDAEGWERMQVLDPSGRVIFDVSASGSLGMQGVTELFFESAEPSFEEQPLDEFLELFPAGSYRFRGRTTDGVPLRGRAELTHHLPDAPVLVSPADGADDVDPEETVIEWNPVPDPPGSRIAGYQVVIEIEEPRLRVFSTDVGPQTTQVTVPPEFLDPGTEYKVEVLAIEEGGNRTISEAEFTTAD